jgi:hypothetical protein
MASNPRILASDTTVVWDGVSTFYPRGTLVDIPAGGPLETAYGGAGNLVSLGPATAQVVSGDTELTGTDPSDAGGGNL